MKSREDYEFDIWYWKLACAMVTIGAAIFYVMMEIVCHLL